MTMRLTFGIDPGLTGAIAVLRDGLYADVLDMPTVGRGKAGRQTVNAGELAAYLRSWRGQCPGADVSAVVEDVASRPGQGVVSMFRFGASCGAVDGVLAALGIPVHRVSPVAWKRACGLLGSDKDASRGKAADLFPDAPLGRKRDHGRADALLLALWHENTQVHGRAAA